MKNLTKGGIRNIAQNADHGEWHDEEDSYRASFGHTEIEVSGHPRRMTLDAGDYTYESRLAEFNRDGNKIIVRDLLVWDAHDGILHNEDDESDEDVVDKLEWWAGRHGGTFTGPFSGQLGAAKAQFGRSGRYEEKSVVTVWPHLPKTRVSMEKYKFDERFVELNRLEEELPDFSMESMTIGDVEVQNDE